MVFGKKKEEPRIDKLEAARQLCRDWWGHGKGTTGSLRGILRELSKDELELIEDFVPLVSEGPTGIRVEALRKIIDKVHGEKG